MEKMIIIGERINSTRMPMRKAIRSRNSSLILDEADRQIRAGAVILDVNCAMGLEQEHQDLDWTISVLQSKYPTAGICIDSPNYRAVEAAMKAYKGTGGIFINSISGDEKRIQAVIPLAMKHHAKVVALTMDEHGMPNSTEERVEVARKITSKVTSLGFKEEDLYFDPLVRPLATEPNQAGAFLDSIPLIHEIGNVRTICGLSNISFGLPKRSLINSVFLSMAISRGLDACILDPADAKVMSSLTTTEALLGRDEFCAEYIKYFRQGKLV